MFKIKEGLLIGNKQVTGDGPTELLTAMDVGTMAYRNSVSAADLSGGPGKTGMWFSADTMYVAVTNGAQSAKVDIGSLTIQHLGFDTTTQESAFICVKMPKNWDEGTVTAKAVWSHPATTTNFGIVFKVQALAISDGEQFNSALGTAVDLADTGGLTDYCYITAESAPITIAGTPVAEDFVIFKIYRDVANAGDNLAVDARLHGLYIYYTANAFSEA